MLNNFFFFLRGNSAVARNYEPVLHIFKPKLNFCL